MKGNSEGYPEKSFESNYIEEKAIVRNRESLGTEKVCKRGGFAANSKHPSGKRKKKPRRIESTTTNGLKDPVPSRSIGRTLLEGGSLH